ncbi:MAG: GNAT family N-acetyltransferase [Microvirga sp.]
MSDEPLALVIRPFADADLPAVRALFVQVNRDLAPHTMRDAFEAYIARSLREEIDRIPAYYAERQGGFWVGHDQDGALLGTFGIERAAEDGAAELRRMYVQPSARRRGVARAMLAHAEAEARRAGYRRIVLSTSELQHAALAFYRGAGYEALGEELATAATNKTVGGGIRRFHFAKRL